MLVAMVVGFLILLLTLVRWGESWRLNQQHRQKLALREGTPSDGRAFFVPSPLDTRRVTPSPPPVFLVPRASSGIASHTVQLVPFFPSKITLYLTRVRALEQDRQRVWRTWWERIMPPDPPPSPAPNGSPEPPLPDLIAVAAQWDRKLTGSLPDSTCLPFHIAYRHYLALERDYIERLVFFQAQGDLVACLRVQQEQQEVLRAAARRVQAKLRELQWDHPELSPELKGLQIGG